MVSVQKTFALSKPLNAKVFPHLLVWLLVAVLYAPILFHLYNGRLELVDYTHAYFILPASLLMVWLKRRELVSLYYSSGSSGAFTFFTLSLLAIGLFLCIVGWKRDYLFIATLSMTPFLAGLIGYLYGPKVLKVLAFPIIYLLFMAPPPLGLLDYLTLPMRDAASSIAEFIFQISQFPVHREGLRLFIGTQEIFIAPACSGFRSLITIICLSLLYVYFLDAGFKKKAVLVLSTIPLALFGNICRILLLCLVAYYFDEKVEKAFHDISGYVVFLIVVLSFILIDNLYKEKPAK